MAGAVDSFTEPTTWFTNGPNGPSGLGWDAGDLLLLFGGTESANRTISAPTDDAVESLTWTSRSTIDTGSSQESEAHIWTAEPTSTESGRTIEVDSTPDVNDDGCALYVISGWDTVSGITGSLSESAFSQTVGAGDLVVVGFIDWNASNPPGKTASTGSGTATTRVDTGNGSTYAIQIFDWVNTSAGTFSFGASNYTSLKVAQVGAVVTPAAATAGGIVVRRFLHRTRLQGVR